MSDFLFHDISYAQGLYNMDTDPNPAIEMKMSGYYYGSKQPYLDVQANRNYANAIRLGKVPILYHFAGGADPIAEANYFITVACAPLAKGDIYELDYELNDSMAPPSDPDSWCRSFADRVKELTGVYPLFYIYTSLFLQHNKFPKTMEVCSLIIADYRYTPDQDVPCGHPYIIQQYTDTPLDTNASFISLDVLKEYAYGYTPPVATTTTTTTTTLPPDTTTTESTTSSTSSTTTTTTLPPHPTPPVKLTFWQWLLILLRRLFHG